MLTIAKLGVGQEGYYLSKVASGLEDYYSGAGEVEGRWLGRGAARLGLGDEVEGTALGALMAGEDPGSGERLAGQRGHRRTPGWDLTFSAPKSVSVLYGLADPMVAEQVAAAHDRAVEEALAWLEAHATVSRRRYGGEIVAVPGEGLVVAAFRHRLSRLGDPQLHTHALATNVVERRDGSWGALDSRPIFGQAQTASRLYQAVLRGQLTDRLGVGWGPVEQGIAEVEGVGAEVRGLFSKRRAQIEAALAEEGVVSGSARAAQVAAYRTRPATPDLEETESLYARWEAEAATIGVDAHQLISDATGQIAVPRPTRQDLEAVIESLADPAQGLCRYESTFDRAGVARAWCERLPAGTPIDLATVEGLVDTALAADGFVSLDPGCGTGPVTIGGDGRSERVGVGEPRWSTVELVEVEADLVRLAEHASQDQTPWVEPRQAEEALAERGELGGDQVAMVRQLTTSPRGLEVVVGRAGAGKTYALATAVDLWRQAGLEPVGVALAARAAAELEAGAGLRSATIAQFLHDTATHGDHAALTSDHVLVVDEAAMVDTRRLHALLAHAQQAGAKVVLVGDHHQLPAVEAGGGFGALVELVGAVELTENRRQIQTWEADALARLRTGTTTEQVVSDYEGHGRIHTGATLAEVRAQMATDWHHLTRAGGEAVMVALRREDVVELNTRARALLVADGTLDDTTALQVGEERFAVGERVVCLRNDRRLGVHNAMAGTVTHLDHDTRTLTFADGEGASHQLPARYLETGHLDHGYAVTIHKAQGATVDHTLVLGDDRLYRQAGYTAVSRGRQTNTIYQPDLDDRDRHPELELDSHGTSDQDQEPIERLQRALNRDQAKHLATNNIVEAAGDDDAEVETLTDLWTRYDRLAYDLGDIPDDPSPLLTARRAELTHLDERIDHLRHRADVLSQPVEPSRWWQRTPRPDPTRLAAADRARDDLAHLEERRDALVANTDQLAAEHTDFLHWCDTNADRLIAFDQLAEHIDWRADQAARAAELTRPAEITDLIGDPPVGDRTAWRQAAAAIESYNARFAHVPEQRLDRHPDHAWHYENVLRAEEAVNAPGLRDAGLVL